MLRRLLGVTLLAVLLTTTMFAGLPAMAVEEEGVDPHDLPSIDEVGTQSEISRQFFPEEAEPAPFTDALVYPLLIVGFLVVLAVLILYLRWQPTFAAEEREKRR